VTGIKPAVEPSQCPFPRTTTKLLLAPRTKSRIGATFSGFFFFQAIKETLLLADGQLATFGQLY